MRGKRGSGIAVDPERVRRARAEAGLSLAALAGTDVSRTFIYQVERGAARPSLAVLKLIAKRTGKSVAYFKRPTPPNAASLELSATLALAARQVRAFSLQVRLSSSEREAMKLIEIVIRRASVMTMTIKS